MTERDAPTSELLLYRTEDGRTRIECRFEEETVWLSQALMAQLFDIGVGTVNHHLKEIYEEGELLSEATIRRYRIVGTEGNRSGLGLGREDGSPDPSFATLTLESLAPACMSIIDHWHLSNAGDDRARHSVAGSAGGTGDECR
jgi:hypothetical protein